MEIQSLGPAPAASSSVLQPAQTSSPAVGSSNSNLQIQTSGNALQPAATKDQALSFNSLSLSGEFDTSPPPAESSFGWLGLTALAVVVIAAVIGYYAKQLSKTAKVKPKS